MDQNKSEPDRSSSSHSFQFQEVQLGKQADVQSEKPSKKFVIKRSHFIALAMALGLSILFYVLGDWLDGLNSDLSATNILNFFGLEIDLQQSSLLLSSALIGVVDGFNPCAMWVLVYLITLVSNLKDRLKMWLIVGIFLVSSGILYYIILALWLGGWEFLELLGLSNMILYAVGLFALIMGVKTLHDFFKQGGKVVCEVGDIEERNRTKSKLEKIVAAPLTIASIFGVIALAFAVNLIEFVCSAGLPAVYTQVLSIADVSLLSKGLYMLVYVFFFMLDDLIIFSLALFAINSPLLDKYSGLSKLIGGPIMLFIGITLLFFPQLLT